MLRPEYVTALTKCRCGCSLQTSKGKRIDAILYGFEGAVEVTHITKRCCSRSCGAYYGYNYQCFQSGLLVNSVKLDDVNVLFVNPKLAFCKKYVRYHDSLQFRGFLSQGAIDFAGRDVLFPHGGHSRDHFQRYYGNARFLLLTMQEFEPLGPGSLFDIVIGDELTEASVVAYDEYMHSTVYPPRDADQVKELCGDGHEKVIVKVCAGSPVPMKRKKKDRAPKKHVPYGNGWFMVSCPRDGRIVGVTQMFEPENNLVTAQTLEKAIPHLKNCDCFILDRNCKAKIALESRPLLKQIRYYPIDEFHAQKHTDGCPCSPLHIRRLKRRIKGVNTSVAEQVFSWFRGYARVLNEMRSLRHRFLVLYLCRRHNDLVDAGETSHLNQYRIGVQGDKKKTVIGYKCRQARASRNPRVVKKKPSTAPTKRNMQKVVASRNPRALKKKPSTAPTKRNRQKVVKKVK